MRARVVLTLSARVVSGALGVAALRAHSFSLLSEGEPASTVGTGPPGEVVRLHLQSVRHAAFRSCSLRSCLSAPTSSTIFVHPQSGHSNCPCSMSKIIPPSV